MTEIEPFGQAVLAIGLIGLAAVLSNRLSERLRVPAPAFFLVFAAAASDLFPNLAKVSEGTVQRVVTVALVFILFDGGMHIGWRRFRGAAAATAWLGVAGTFVTAGAVAAAAHLLFGISWRLALLLGTALSPTDPAVVFSVLGRREVGGRSGVILEGESGANDPVGIALLIALIGATGSPGSAAGHVAVTFVLQMAAGAGIGVMGGWLLLEFMRRVPLPNEGLYSLRVLAGVLSIYGLATVAHGSGFLATFAAGILIGDERAPYKREIARFHSSLASLAEIIAFIMLGLTISLRDLPAGGAWSIGLALGALLAFVIRPLLVGLLTLPIRLKRGERLFLLWTGLKGAVPVLLGTFIVQSGVAGASRAYEIIFVVVAFSVVVQGGFVPVLAHRLGVPLRTIDPEPWSLGVRFREEPEGLHRFRVTKASPAAGTSIEDLPCGENTWVIFIIRHGRLVPARSETRMQPGDEVLVLAEPAEISGLRKLFTPARGTESHAERRRGGTATRTRDGRRAAGARRSPIARREPEPRAEAAPRMTATPEGEAAQHGEAAPHVEPLPDQDRRETGT
ncbi:MAG TPA: potassium/proton antiporter [Streptosporangiaceae bacterium]|nr:potassium/proton antiporter [Streptosporangiaceae bacterium]